MLIDIHAHVWGNQVVQSKQQLLGAMDRYGIDRIYVSGLQTLNPSEEEVCFLNDTVAAFIQEAPDRIGGAVDCAPKHKNTMREIRRGIEEQGFEMIKFGPAALRTIHMWTR